MGHLRQAVTFTLCLLVPALAGAQDRADVQRIRRLVGRPEAAGASRLTLPVPPGQVEIRVGMPPLLARRAQTVVREERRSVVRTVLGAAVGTVGGFFAGGYLGAKIEGNDCNCDDPGLKGFLIGAPIGAVTGGILGGLFLF